MPCSGNSAAPTLTPTYTCAPPAGPAPTRVWIKRWDRLSMSAMPAMPDSRMTNSSPPGRAMKSRAAHALLEPRRDLAQHAVAGAVPIVSLIVLKRSRSRNSSANRRRPRCAASTASCRRCSSEKRFGSPVRRSLCAASKSWRCVRLSSVMSIETPTAPTIFAVAVGAAARRGGAASARRAPISTRTWRPVNTSRTTSSATSTLARLADELVARQAQLAQRAARHGGEAAVAADRPQHRVDVVLDQLQAVRVLVQLRLRDRLRADVLQ